MKPLVLVTAPVGTRSGYGAHSRDICRSLIDLDKYDVRIWPVRWGSTPQNALSEENPQDQPIIKRLLKSPEVERQPEVHIHIVVPNEFNALGKYNIGITAGIETTVCPAYWIEGLNRMDLNIVPAKFVKDTIENTSFDKFDEKTKQKIGRVVSEKPVEVLFEGVDSDIYKTTKEFSVDLVEEMGGVKEDFCFLHVGHWLQGNLGEDRKDLGMLVKVFYETFKNQKNQPALILKTSGATPCILDREDILKKINNIKKEVKGKLPNVYVLHGDLRDEEINQLYNHPKVKSHITFTHGEGFGRPLLEASLSEKPIIASNWSGQLDFLNTDALLLPGGLVNVPKGSFPKEFNVEGSQWFQVNYQYASNVMKEVFNNYDKYKTKAKKLAIVNKTKFTLSAMTIKLDEILEKYLPKFEVQPQKVDLKLPTLKKVSEPKQNLGLPKLKKVGG
jgi:glycosyltransferase involved in cell wall biosynthesis